MNTDIPAKAENNIIGIGFCISATSGAIIVTTLEKILQIENENGTNKGGNTSELI